MLLEMAPNEYVDTDQDGTQYAFRVVGLRVGRPLICLQHFSGTMDAWDPEVINGLSKNRSVVVFNNKGVGQSTGETPESIEEMARDAIAFIRELGYEEVDLLGYSLGGMVAQIIAVQAPELVRRIILVGTAPRGGEEHLLEEIARAKATPDAPDLRLPLFFTSSAKSQAAGQSFLKRSGVRKMCRDPDNGDIVVERQAKALITWCATPDPSHEVLRAIKHDVLIVGGSDDKMLPSSNAYLMFKELPAAQLILYPDSGHGSIFQHPARFVSHADKFLSE